MPFQFLRKQNPRNAFHASEPIFVRPNPARTLKRGIMKPRKSSKRRLQIYIYNAEKDRKLLLLQLKRQPSIHHRSMDIILLYLNRDQPEKMAPWRPLTPLWLKIGTAFTVLAICVVLPGVVATSVCGGPTNPAKGSGFGPTSVPVSPFRIARTLSTITASMPSLVCNYNNVSTTLFWGQGEGKGMLTCTFFGSLFCAP